jgi:branched-chain amino acid aminotransferase
VPGDQGDPAALAYVDGRILPQDEAMVSVLDSGLNFADGVFEGIRVHNGRVFRLDAHLDRLYASAAAFAIDIGMTKDELCGEILRWLREAGVWDDFHFRPIVTRGKRFPPRLDPRFASGPATVLIVGAPASHTQSPGIRTIVSSVRRPAPDVLDPHVKSLNYGPALLARLEATRRGVDDALLLDERALLAEASTANVFLVVDGSLVTPAPRACLHGITRSVVLELARIRGEGCDEVEVDAELLRRADEVFVTGTGIGLVPVVEIDGRPVGDGSPGPLTARLAAEYRKLVGAEGTPI